MSEPADVVFIRCPRREGIAVEAVDSNNTGEALLSTCTALVSIVVLTRYLRLALESTAL